MSLPKYNYEYKLLTEENSSTFEKKLNELITEGWSIVDNSFKITNYTEYKLQYSILLFRVK